MSVLVTIKCPCSTCNERIEYPPDMCGKQITCPHCQQVTLLLAPQIPPEAQVPLDEARLKHNEVREAFEIERDEKIEAIKKG